MKKLKAQDYAEIRQWMYRNARQIEMALWQYYYENGSQESVLAALAMYQNADGGFGNALEADSWNMESSPYTTLYAINILSGIHFTDTGNPLMQGIFRFLESGVYSDDDGWWFNSPTNDDYPHAPWWTYDSSANKFESIGVSAGIAGFILQFSSKDTQIYQKALLVADKLIEKLHTPENLGEMGVGGYIALIDVLHRLNMADRFDLDFLSDSVKQLVNKAIERDVSKWGLYGKKPADFIRSPESEFYAGNEEILQQELDYTVDTRVEKGVWGITWSWFDNNEKYPKEFAIAENWWKAAVAIEKVRLLKNFGRIE